MQYVNNWDDNCENSVPQISVFLLVLTSVKGTFCSSVGSDISKP